MQSKLSFKNKMLSMYLQSFLAIAKIFTSILGRQCITTFASKMYSFGLYYVVVQHQAFNLSTTTLFKQTLS